MAKTAAPPETGTATVTVALKHPTGIILDVFREETAHEPVMGGGTRPVKVFRSTGKQYPLNGNRVPFGTTPNYMILGGWALTPGIPKDVWETWLSQHHDHALVENGLIDAHENADYVEDFAKDPDRVSLKSGLEPLLRKGDPRVDKRRTREGKFVDAIEAADEQAKAA